MKNNRTGNSVKSFFHSFKFAANGLVIFSRLERNALIHAVISMIVILAGFHYKISRMEWIAIVVCMGLVFSTEIINTSIEKLTDLVQPAFSEKAGKVKDLAAAAVLISALVALITGVIIFLPYIKKNC